MTMLDRFDAEHTTHPSRASRLLFEWLSDDERRTELYRCLSDNERVLAFQSRAVAEPRLRTERDFGPTVYLLTDPAHIERALTDTEHFSNEPYRALGSGTFMLGVSGDDQREQRDFAQRHFKIDSRQVDALARLAFEAASFLPFKDYRFDLALLAEQVALRFVGTWFGFASADHVLLEDTMRKAYRGLNYQILGRHFVTEPGLLREADEGLGRLVRRVAALIDLHQAAKLEAHHPVPISETQMDALKALSRELDEARSDPALRQGFVPVLQRIASDPGRFSCQALAVIVVGAIAGIIGNVQASAAAAIDHYFKGAIDPAAWRRAAAASSQYDAGARKSLIDAILQAIARQPPAAFLPRRAIKEVSLSLASGGVRIPPDTNVILAMGACRTNPPNAASRPPPAWTAPAEDVIFGGPDPDQAGRFAHACIGRHIALPLVARIVEQVLLLPGLERTLDPRTGQFRGLRKTWGFASESFPLYFDRGQRLVQQPLNVVMRVRMPTAVHAEAIKRIIASGAPSIERALKHAEHVHFAWFRLQRDDTELALHTVYDGNFDVYIEHFVSEIGPLFDLLFEHLQDASPRPVRRHPKEFVDTIRRYDQAPEGGYFFSAYPARTVSMIHASAGR